jgi:hypothetical protein
MRMDGTVLSKLLLLSLFVCAGCSQQENPSYKGESASEAAAAVDAAERAAVSEPDSYEQLNTKLDEIAAEIQAVKEKQHGSMKLKCRETNFISRRDFPMEFECKEADANVPFGGL